MLMQAASEPAAFMAAVDLADRRASTPLASSRIFSNVCTSAPASSIFDAMSFPFDDPVHFEKAALAWAGEYNEDIKRACEESLIELTAYLWDIADPGEPLVTGWAMDAIAEHLEATFYDHIRRLLITVPPGFSKSSLTNVF